MTIASSVPHLDHPARLISIAGANQVRQVCENLTLTDKDNVTVPWLLDGWEPNETLDEWTLYLRQGVRFSNGQELTADDLIFNIEQWLSEDLGSPMLALIGRYLFASALADVDAVSGATVSSEAIVPALQVSGRNFARQVLGRSVEPAGSERPSAASHLFDTRGIYLIAAFLLALIVMFKGGFWTRLLVLAGNLAVGGLWLNAQYSCEQIVTALSWHAPSAALTGAFVLVVGIPLLVAIFGNVYCGYVCPFGAVQELTAYIVPRRFKPRISVETMRGARFVKYVVLTVMIVVFFVSRDRTTLADPLISIFNFRLSVVDFHKAVTLLAAGALVASVFCTRFWCRYLCPAGALLSLLSAVAVLRRHMPVKKYGKCEFGLTATDSMDCIYCDKCRYEQFSREKSHRKEVATVFLTCVVAVAVVVSAISADRFFEVMGTDLDTTITAASGGQTRDVDPDRIRRLIDQKRLSDKEAEYYKRIE